MFHSAALKLTLWYLAIIMAISLIFSGLLYRVSSQELQHNVNRQLGYFNNFLGPNDFNIYNDMRQRQLNEDTGSLRASLVFFNVLVLAAGGGASYWLARRTLTPIEAALIAQSRFAADASHELRTPLTAIQTENEVALRNPRLTKDDAVSLVKSNLEEVAKLRALSEGLLRLANGAGQEINVQPVEIGGIIKKSIERYAKAAEAKNMTIVRRIPASKVTGDPEALVELFSILIDNAIKYSDKSTKISISSKPRNKLLEVRIADQGRGIAAGDLPHIFERFYRTDSSRSRDGSGGYGLGLAIAKRIAELHKGYITVESDPGKGSAFTVSLPSE
jgi:two-component system, OmpR family, sensor histidine kinase CiaH